VVRSATVEFVAYSASEDPTFLGVLSGSMVLAAVTGAATFVILQRHERAKTFCLSAVDELRKVIWPTREDTTAQTTVVVVAALSFGLLMFVYDLGWANLTKLVLYPGTSN